MTCFALKVVRISYLQCAIMRKVHPGNGNSSRHPPLSLQFNVVQLQISDKPILLPPIQFVGIAEISSRNRKMKDHDKSLLD
jgi:hypothetical protein